jgi:hypothetical protein
MRTNLKEFYGDNMKAVLHRLWSSWTETERVEGRAVYSRAKHVVGGERELATVETVGHQAAGVIGKVFVLLSFQSAKPTG